MINNEGDCTPNPGNSRVNESLEFQEKWGLRSRGRHRDGNPSRDGNLGQFFIPGFLKIGLSIADPYYAVSCNFSWKFL